MCRIKFKIDNKNKMKKIKNRDLNKKMIMSINLNYQINTKKMNMFNFKILKMKDSKHNSLLLQMMKIYTSL